MRVRVLGRLHRPYPSRLRRRLLAMMAPAASSSQEFCRLNTAVGHEFAAAGEAMCAALGISRPDLIGSHGQTVCHLPPRTRRRSTAARSMPDHGDPTAGSLQLGDATTGSLQLGDAAIIAARLGVPVVSQFRQADMAVGGQGAPLVPWTDYVLFRHPLRHRVIQNLGGIANLTWLPAAGGEEQVLGFDTGPGNMLIDAVVRHFSGGRRHFDRNGRLATRGRADPGVLRSLLDHPFLSEQPPRSCGREEFGDQQLAALLRRFASHRLAPHDWAATATTFTAASIVLAYAVFLAPSIGRFPPMDEIILCGGGADNPVLVRELSSALSFNGWSRTVSIATTDDYGIPAQAKECVSFAMLAAACVDGVPANLPQVTGASRRVVLGQVCTTEPAR